MASGSFLFDDLASFFASVTWSGLRTPWAIRISVKLLFGGIARLDLVPSSDASRFEDARSQAPR